MTAQQCVEQVVAVVRAYAEDKYEEEGDAMLAIAEATDRFLYAKKSK